MLCLQRAKTDAFEGLELENPERPEARNLLTIYQCVTGMSQASGVEGSRKWSVEGKHGTEGMAMGGTGGVQV